MAKQGSKTIVEKIADKVNDIVHPTQQDSKAEADKAPAPEVEKASKPKSAYKSEMGKHKKFDKFN